ncbi:MAG TPA: alpha/beta hydrolase [Tepidisphaeraceae bacterium]|nr:alpha/beta hydrolase [Tepidisphaeraceae bacterium]
MRIPGRPLAICLHAWVGGPAGLADVASAVRDTFPTADVRLPTFPGAWHSRANPAELAATLADTIARAFDPVRHTETLLVGHSLGGLLITKAFVYAAGAAGDLPVHWRERALAWRAWAGSVRRIVCFAGLLRGWALPWRGRVLPPAKWLGMRAAAVLGATALAPLGVGRLIGSVRRGSPLVTRLAAQWAALSRAGVELPVVTQIHGTRDELLTPADIVGPGGPVVRYVPVEGAGHEDVVALSKYPDARRALVEAIQ